MNSATLLSRRPQPSQMVINEVERRVQQGALTVLNAMPLLGLMAAYPQGVLHMKQTSFVRLRLDKLSHKHRLITLLPR